MKIDYIGHCFLHFSTVISSSYGSFVTLIYPGLTDKIYNSASFRIVKK